MFDFLYSEEKKTRSHASNWLEVADRVYKFQCDLLTDAQRQRLVTATDDVKLRLKERASVPKLKASIEKLEVALREAGGRHYPVSSLVENVEFFLVASIMILGLRAYFVQPFKIPTNSMWPTYYGMTHEAFAEGQEPGLLKQIGRFLGLGASHYEVTAPADGEILLPVFAGNGRLAYTLKPGKTLVVFPSTRREYTISVGGEWTRISVPADFDLESVLDQRFTGRDGGLQAIWQERMAQPDQHPESSIMHVTLGGPGSDRRVLWMPVGRNAVRGQKIFSFDILTGDLLFVDRFTYNFLPPRVGQGFVFKTENIHNENMEDPSGNQIRQYYIKRLVGTPGDTLEVRPPALLRNGRPIEGAAAFQRNAQREGKYPGYTNVGLLSAGNVVTVLPDHYFAMGDNSPRSADSRYWGFVPDKDVVGRPLFIYYPLTDRWGPAR